MYDRRSWGTRARSVKRSRLAAILCSSLLTINGCGIPTLRCAQPGPALPAGYNLNNGARYWGADVAPEQSGPGGGGTESSNAALPGQRPVRLASASVEHKGGPTAVVTHAGNAAGSVDVQPNNAVGSDGLMGYFRAGNRQQQPPTTTLSAPLSSVDTATEVTAELIPVPAGEGSVIEAEFDPARSIWGTGESESSAQVPQATFFSDPCLRVLIEEALVGNQELRILAEEIRIAENESYARSGEYRPFVTLGGRAGLEKSGRYTREGAVEEQLEVAPGKKFPDPLPNFLVAADVSWEIDIWKRLRNARDAATLRYLATQDGRNYIVTRMVAEISENYFNLLALDSRLQTLEQTIRIQQLSLEIAQAQKDAGRGTELAVRRFEAEVRKNQSEQSIIAQEIVEVENRINFLVGRYPQPVERAKVQFVDLYLNTLSSGVPSQLLQNRADIRQAEREIAAAGLDVKVARARFYPSLTLTSGLGWNAFSTGYLFKTPESLIYSVAGELVGPLINKRAIQAAYLSANAAQLQSIYEYQQTVLTAHIEVVNYITRVENYRRSIEAKRQQLESLEAAVESATQLFQSARTEYLEVLLAQRELMEAKMVLIDVKQEQLSSIVNAYQALGGGGF